MSSVSGCIQGFNVVTFKVAFCKKNIFLGLILILSNNDALGFSTPQKLTLWNCRLAQLPSQSVVI